MICVECGQPVNDTYRHFQSGGIRVTRCVRFSWPTVSRLLPAEVHTLAQINFPPASVDESALTGVLQERS
jgi:hypothetical protein